MESNDPKGGKSISEALDDGTLIDVSEVVRAQHLRCPTFLSSALWHGKLKRSKDELSKRLATIYYMYEGCFGFRK